MFTLEEAEEDSSFLGKMKKNLPQMRVELTSFIVYKYSQT